MYFTDIMCCFSSMALEHLNIMSIDKVKYTFVKDGIEIDSYVVITLKCWPGL